VPDDIDYSDMMEAAYGEPELDVIDDPALMFLHYSVGQGATVRLGRHLTHSLLQQPDVVDLKNRVRSDVRNRMPSTCESVRISINQKAHVATGLTAFGTGSLNTRYDPTLNLTLGQANVSILGGCSMEASEAELTADGKCRCTITAHCQTTIHLYKYYRFGERRKQPDSFANFTLSALFGAHHTAVAFHLMTGGHASSSPMPFVIISDVDWQFYEAKAIEWYPSQ
jgi:hypothetical protein